MFILLEIFVQKIIFHFLTGNKHKLEENGKII